MLPGVGAAGVVLIVTDVVEVELVQPDTVALTEYVPALAVLAFVIVGFCEEDEKLFGPLQLYVAALIVLAVSVIVFPEHKGGILPAVGADGIGLTVTEVVPAVLVQPETVAVTEYVPLAAVVAEAIVAFCEAEEKPFGPVQA